eukprot:COSAG05_NODE_1937_length_3810_cov_2.941287_3_plen_123_part_00
MGLKLYNEQSGHICGWCVFCFVVDFFQPRSDLDFGTTEFCSTLVPAPPRNFAPRLAHYLRQQFQIHLRGDRILHSCRFGSCVRLVTHRVLVLVQSGSQGATDFLLLLLRHLNLQHSHRHSKI